MIIVLLLKLPLILALAWIASQFKTSIPCWSQRPMLVPALHTGHHYISTSIPASHTGHQYTSLPASHAGHQHTSTNIPASHAGPAYQHQNTTYDGFAGMTSMNYAGHLCWFFEQGGTLGGFSGQFGRLRAKQVQPQRQLRLE